ncbi:dicarboxylate/amino acid:cation (Na+ or H+) symporter, DAACS family [Pseudoxanthomonas sp. GM95]|uniref:dicarboxylate/amino acid:cation symporter n=1 Tax=Pseudoxanthomonas sp. GM95 TaxID=1881043 RepID=UPI0008ACA230|nr:dicarboxylate/amino acid:cation symporter [Pseudoxanthomonas sp. GM95]SEL70550.1 dicarboxylate/amino acid:cation (Na+ or H+) symporter, DAACS family [Pseudoxanthomonas sp. GM95]
MTDAPSGKSKLPLHWKMVIGFMAGLVLGLIVHSTVGADAGWVKTLTGITQPAGNIFLRLIFMLVLPLLFSALVVGISEMGDVRSLGRIGWKTLGYTILASGIAVVLGLVLVNVLKPGTGTDPATAQQMLAAGADRAQAIISKGKDAPGGADMLLSIVPSNVVSAAADDQIMGVMFFALMVGVGVVLTRTEKTAVFRNAVEGLFEISMTLITLVIRLAPYAVFCFMFNLAALFGWDLLLKLGAYVGVVVLALAIHMFVVYSALLKWAGWSPVKWFGAVREVMVLSFSTASSNATLPTSLRVAEENLHLPRKVSRFVLTVGATANQNGTALFEGVTVLFLAQFFGVELSITQQLTVMFVCILGGIGTAGVPAGSLPVVALICGMVGVPPEGIGIILGVDRFLDMCRTTLNTTGDLVLSTLVSKGEKDEPDPDVVTA